MKLPDRKVGEFFCAKGTEGGMLNAKFSIQNGDWRSRVIASERRERGNLNKRSDGRVPF